MANKAIYKDSYPIKKPDGSTERRQSSWWYIRWTDSSGRQHKMRAAPTKKQAQEVLIKKLSEVAAEKAGLPTNNIWDESLEGLLKRFLAAKEPHITEKQLGEIESELRRAFKAMKVWCVRDITPEAVEQYLNQRAGSGLAPRTVNKTLEKLKSIFNWCVDMGDLAANPLARLKPRPQYEKKRKRRILTEEEIHRLLKACDGVGWLKTGVLLALYCGLRVSDIRRLIWSDINLEAKEITIRPEAEKSRRGAVLPIHHSLKSALKAWKMAEESDSEGHVVRLTANPIRPLKKALEKAGVPYRNESGEYVDWHSLRHTFLTSLDRAGAGVKELQGLGRHSDPSLTLGVYVHSSRKREARAVSLLPDYTNGPDTKEEPRKKAKSKRKGVHKAGESELEDNHPKNKTLRKRKAGFLNRRQQGSVS